MSSENETRIMKSAMMFCGAYSAFYANKDSFCDLRENKGLDLASSRLATVHSALIQKDPGNAEKARYLSGIAQSLRSKIACDHFDVVDVYDLPDNWSRETRATHTQKDDLQEFSDVFYNLSSDQFTKWSECSNFIKHAEILKPQRVSVEQPRSTSGFTF